MSHTNLPQNCTVFLLLFEHTQSAIYASQKMDSHKWLTVLVDEVKENLAILGHVCVDHCILLLKHLSTHMRFISNGYKCFSKTSSADPRQHVPFNCFPLHF